MREISMEERQTLEEAYRSEKNAKVKIRILALLCLYVDGYTLEATAKLLRISIGSVQEYKRKYDQGKLKELRQISCSSGRPSALSESQQTELRDRVSSEHFLNSNAVCAHVQKKYAVSYTANAMTKLLKRLGFVHKKPKTAPGKATAAKQETFLTETLKPLLAEAGESGSTLTGPYAFIISRWSIGKMPSLTPSRPLLYSLPSAHDMRQVSGLKSLWTMPDTIMPNPYGLLLKKTPST